MSKPTEFYTSLVEESIDAIMVVDADFKIIYRSPAIVRLTGWTTEELMKTGGQEQIHPDDFAGLKQITKLAVANPGQQQRVSFSVKQKTGTYVWLEGVMTNLLGNENIKGIVFNLRDVTRRLESDVTIKRILSEVSKYKYALDESSIVGHYRSKRHNNPRQRQFLYNK